MAKSYRNGRSPWLLLLLLLVGGILGSSLTGVVAAVLPAVASGTKVGLHPTSLDLNFVQVNLGFLVTLSPLTALGLVLGYLLYRWL